MPPGLNLMFGPNLPRAKKNKPKRKKTKSFNGKSRKAIERRTFERQERRRKKTKRQTPKRRVPKPQLRPHVRRAPPIRHEDQWMRKPQRSQTRRKEG